MTLLDSPPPVKGQRRRPKLRDWNLGVWRTDPATAGLPGATCGEDSGDPVGTQGARDMADPTVASPDDRAEPTVSAPPPSGPGRVRLRDWPAAGRRPAGLDGDDRPAGPGLPIDPRIQQRRVEVRRLASRRRVQVGAAALGAAAVVAAIVVVLQSSLVGIRHLDVTGTDGHRKAAVAAAGGVRASEPLVRVRPSAVEARLQRLPWVASARVRRSWPSTLRIAIVPRRAVAQVPVGASPSGPVVLVDVTGRVIRRAAAPVSGLPIVLGAGRPGAPGSWLAGSAGAGQPVGSPATQPAGVLAELSAARDGIQAALAVAVALAHDQSLRTTTGSRPHLVQLDLAADDALSAVVNPGGVTVSLGDATQLAGKVTTLETLLADVPLTGIAAIDDEVPNRPTTTPRVVGTP